MSAADPQLSVNQDLTGARVGRFVIRALLGSGGMGEVYRADDTRLKRPVALKRVSRKLSAESGARQRILKEAERASALNSPYIAAVYDVLEEKGEVFLVMEYVEGTSLRQRLQTSGRFSRAEFLKIAVQCAEALVAAQEKSVVHCDLKPENILITRGGQAKVLDFGLARHLPPAGAEEVTATAESLQWSLAGTPGYMAPEVLLGGLPDHRSDIFALGVVFYELLTGSYPFGAQHNAAAPLQVSPAPICELVPAVSTQLESIIAKMLAKSPDERYSRAADLLTDLRALENGRPFLVPSTPRARHLKSWIAGRGIALAVAIILVLAIAPTARQRWRHWSAGADLPEKKNLAVLPFGVVGDDPGAQAFAQGLAETLNGKLTQLTENYPLQVFPPSEIRSQRVDSVEQARRELGANLVVEGTLQQFGSQVRVTYHLVDTGTRQQLRADTVTAQAGDPFAMEDRVVQSVLRSLDLELQSTDRRTLQAHGTSTPAAYDYYLRGRGYLMEYQKPENVDSAIEVFARALERDPKYTPAYSGLGESYWHKYELTHAAEWVTRALDACQKAAALIEGAICLGNVYNETGKYDQAVREFQRALQVDTSSDDAYRGLAFAYEHLGRTAEAEQTYRRAITIRPHYWAGYNWLGVFLFSHGRFEEAANMFQQVTTLAPDSFRGYQNLGGAYTALGRFDQAVPALERSVQIRPSAAAYSNLGTVYFYLHRFTDAASVYEQAVKLDNHNYVLWGNLAEAYYWSQDKRAQSSDTYRRALVLAQEQLKVNPRQTSALGQVALASAMLGDSKNAEQNLRQALTLAPDDPDLQLRGAVIESHLGHQDRAFALLQRALAGGIAPEVVRNHPTFDDLAKTEHWQTLMREKELMPRK